MPKHHPKVRHTPSEPLYVMFSCKARNPDGSTLKLKRVLFRELIDVLTVFLQQNGTADLVSSDGKMYHMTNTDYLRLEMEEP